MQFAYQFMFYDVGTNDGTFTDNDFWFPESAVFNNLKTF